MNYIFLLLIYRLTVNRFNEACKRLKQASIHLYELILNFALQSTLKNIYPTLNITE